MKLYEINQAYYDWLNKVEEAEGEMTAELMTEIDGIQGDAGEKFESYAAVIKTLEAEEEAISAEITRLSGRKKSKKDIIDKLRENLIASMELFGKPSHKSAKWTISLRKSASVEIMDESAVPDSFFKVKKEIAKSLIAEELKLGNEVPGAALKEKTGVQIR